MTINTKYNIDDTVYFIYNSRIEEVQITSIKFTTTRSKLNSHIFYGLSRTSDEVYEIDLYSTKEEAGLTWLKEQGLDCNIATI